MTRGEEAAEGVERADLFEAQDVSANGVIIFLASLLGSLFVTFAFAWGVWVAFERVVAPVGATPTPRLSQVPPEPRIQPDPRLDLWNMRAHEDSVLNSYGWSNRQEGTVRIPIDRAIDLLVQRGLPIRPETGSAPTVADTGSESGGPQTGKPVPRFSMPERGAQ